MPGHWMEIEASGEVRTERYWELPVTAAGPLPTESYYIETYREMLEQACQQSPDE